MEETYENRSEAVRAYGLQKGAYERWVYGRSSPSIEALAKIAQVAGVSLDWLAFGTATPTPVSDDYTANVQLPDNYDWMKEILGLLEDIYILTGHNSPPNSYFHQAADIYKEVIKWEKSDERSRAITMAIGLLAPHIKPPETEIDKLQA